MRASCVSGIAHAPSPSRILPTLHIATLPYRNSMGSSNSAVTANTPSIPRAIQAVAGRSDRCSASVSRASASARLMWLSSTRSALISSTRLTSSASASASILPMSGSPTARSQRETALSVTFSFSASASCVSPRSLRRCTINSPSFTASITHLLSPLCYHTVLVLGKKRSVYLPQKWKKRGITAPLSLYFSLRTMSREISAMLCAPHIRMVSASSALSFSV